MTATEVLVVLGMAVAVYVPKLVPLVLVSDDLVRRVRPWLEFVAPAVLGALVAPSIVASAVDAWPASAASFVVALLVALVSRRMLPSLAAGLAVLVAGTVIRP
jgi:branched-subunit amino acid transport protein